MESVGSLKKVALRKEWDQKVNYTNEVELLEEGVKLWATYFVDPTNGLENILSHFTIIDETVEPKKGWGIEMIGYTLPYGEPKINIGDHFIAKHHDQIPQITLKTWNYYVVRNTYTIDELKKEELGKDTEKFLKNQLLSFSNNLSWWFQFLSYEIFTDLEKENGNFDESLQNPYFEEFKQEIYNPSNKDTNGIPFYDHSLVLEKLPAFNPGRKVTDNPIKTCIDGIRGRLRINTVQYNKAAALFQHDIPEASKNVFALREKIEQVSLEIQTNVTKYRLADNFVKNQDGQVKQRNGFGVIAKKEDLIAIVSPEDERILRASIPNLITPTTYGFSPETLQVGKVLKSFYFKPGTALIIHKDALKLIIISNKVREAEYPEHWKKNRINRVGFMLDTFDIFPVAFIKPQ